MSKIIVLLLVLAAVPAVFLAAALALKQDSEPVRHVVVFKYKQDAAEDQIRQVTREFRALQHRIDGITAFEYGVNNSPEGLDRGFTHIYLMTFENVAARDAYLPHPEHEKFVGLLGELDILEEAFVVDYVPVE
jgi:hypothetical protein